MMIPSIFVRILCLLLIAYEVQSVDYVSETDTEEPVDNAIEENKILDFGVRPEVIRQSNLNPELLSEEHLNHQKIIEEIPADDSLRQPQFPLEVENSLGFARIGYYPNGTRIKYFSRVLRVPKKLNPIRKVARIRKRTPAFNQNNHTPLLHRAGGLGSNKNLDSGEVDYIEKKEHHVKRVRVHNKDKSESGNENEKHFEEHDHEQTSHETDEDDDDSKEDDDSNFDEVDDDRTSQDVLESKDTFLKKTFSSNTGGNFNTIKDDGTKENLKSEVHKLDKNLVGKRNSFRDAMIELRTTLDKAIKKFDESDEQEFEQHSLHSLKKDVLQQIVRTARSTGTCKLSKLNSKDRRKREISSLEPFKTCIYIDVPGNHPSEQVDVFYPSEMFQPEVSDQSLIVTEVTTSSPGSLQTSERITSTTVHITKTDTIKEEIDLNSLYWLRLPMAGKTFPVEVHTQLNQIVEDFHESGQDVLFVPIPKGYSNTDELKSAFIKSLEVNPIKRNLRKAKT